MGTAEAPGVRAYGHAGDGSGVGGATIARILPAGVWTEDTREDPPGVVLFPAEEAVLARAVDKRRREFTTVRGCARKALARMGVAPVALVPGERGAPVWPPGVVGSMTHCDGYRAAAVADARHMLTIGIDAEPAEPLPEGVAELVASDAERARLADHARRFPHVPWERLLFSAKESVYKAWFPLTHRWLDFADADVHLEPAPVGGAFSARLLVSDRPLDVFEGRWLVHEGIAVTAIVVPREG